jgi:glycosyltransferase involved in cell wall biosynthesis
MVPDALRSALGQSVPPDEVVIVDDGSDPPFELPDPDPRVTLVRLTTPRGVCSARNAGLARATGDWVAFLDDDDELHPEMLELSLDAAARSTLPPPVAVVSGVEIVGHDGVTERVRLPASSRRGRDYALEDAPRGRSFAVGNTLVIPRDVLVRIGGFDEQLRSTEHSELLLRVNAVCSIEGVPIVTYRIRRHGRGHIHGDAWSRARAMERTERTHREAFDRHRARHATYLSATGIWFLKAGRWGDALRSTTRALLLDPFNRRVVQWWAVSLGGPSSIRLYRRMIRLRAMRGGGSRRAPG